MTLVVFDMDRTLLNAQSQISRYTQETLRLMRQAEIDYTIATGRTLQAALQPLDDNASTARWYSKMVRSFGNQASEAIATIIYSPRLK